MSNFVWETDQEEKWETVAAERVDPAKPPKRSWRRSILVSVALIALISAVSVVAVRRIQTQIASAEVLIRKDTLSSHELLMSAFDQQDDELLTALLSGRDVAWVSDQQERLAQGHLFERHWLGLTRLGEPTIVNVQINPEHTEVTLLTEQTYRDRYGQLVTLTHTSLYRHGQARWLMSPPMAGFWGNGRVNSDQTFRVEYPSRDEALVERLTADLQALVKTLCQPELDLNCTSDLRLRLDFATDAGVLNDLQAPDYSLQAVDKMSLRLPTPTLAGLPTNESSYQALLHGYARPVLTTLIAHLTAQPCCDHRLLVFQALVDQQLAQLAVQPHPVTTQEYRRFFAEPFPIRAEALLSTNRRTITSDLSASGLFTPQAAWRTEILVDYLLDASPLSTAEIQRRLTAGRFGWLEGLLPETTQEERYTAVVQRAYERGIEAAPPISLAPTQDVMALCLATDERVETAVMRYHADEQRWRPEERLTDGSVRYLTIVNDDADLLTAEVAPNGGRTTLTMYSDDREIPIRLGDTLPTQQLEVLPIGISDQIATFYQSSDSPEFYAIATESCRQQPSCYAQPIPSIPLWSPDVQHMWTFSQSLYVADDRGVRLPSSPAEANWPVAWLSDTIYSYTVITRTESGRPAIQELYYQELDAPQAQPLLTQAEIERVTATFSSNPADIWRINWFTSLPDDPDVILFLFINELPSSQIFLVFYNWRTQEIVKTIAESPIVPVNFPFSAVHSRWLLWREINPNEQGSNPVFLMDLTQKEIISSFVTFNDLFDNVLQMGFDFSRDDEWFLRFEDQFMALHHLPSEQLQVVLYDESISGCVAGGWIQRE